MKKLKIIVLAKQVPDTRNVGKNAMKADGTVNRSALPAIFNPEDLNALEQALRIKDKYENTEVNILTMGPPRAAEIIREGIYRGADKSYLLTDRKFAGSDTLATSYAISQAIKKIENYDIIIAGRQAIDGDTAQVGPQIAEKLNIPQVTYCEEILDISENKIKIKRRLERGIEIVLSDMPILITVHSSAAECRFRNAKFFMKFKHSRTKTELKRENETLKKLNAEREYLNIQEWNVQDVNADTTFLGLDGSPTKVKKIENVVMISKKETKVLDESDESINFLMKELINNHKLDNF